MLATLSTAATTKFFLRSISTHASFNHLAFGGVGSQNGVLVGGLQPLQTLPVGGTIANTVLSFEDMDPTDPGPAYFIHGAVGSWIQLNVFGTPQSGYSLDSQKTLAVTGNGKFYACERSTGGTNPVVIGVFYNVQGKAVPGGCFAVQLEAVTCTSSTCA